MNQYLLKYEREIIMKIADSRKTFEEMADKWPSSVVARAELAKFTGGILHPRSQANLDSLGQGCEMVKIGRIVAYPVKSLVEWLIERAEK